MTRYCVDDKSYIEKNKKQILRKIYEVTEEIDKIQKKSKVSNRYSYANLETILEVLNPILKKKQMLITTEVTDTRSNKNKDDIVTSVYCLQSSEYVSSKFSILSIDEIVKVTQENRIKLIELSKDNSHFKIPLEKNPYHEYASGMTYARRYNITNIFNLSYADDDNDANISPYYPQKKIPYYPQKKTYQINPVSPNKNNYAKSRQEQEKAINEFYGKEV